ncbi:hypothetical protein ACHAO4_009059 [Trichoderma viride]
MAERKNGNPSLETNDIHDKDSDQCQNTDVEDIEMPKKKFKTLQFEEGECGYEDAIARIRDYQKQATLLSVKDVLQLETRHHRPNNTLDSSAILNSKSSTSAVQKKSTPSAQKAPAPTKLTTSLLMKMEQETRQLMDRMKIMVDIKRRDWEIAGSTLDIMGKLDEAANTRNGKSQKDYQVQIKETEEKREEYKRLELDFEQAIAEERRKYPKDDELMDDLDGLLEEEDTTEEDA